VLYAKIYSPSVQPKSVIETFSTPTAKRATRKWTRQMFKKRGNIVAKQYSCILHMQEQWVHSIN
jgi:hypothetical protein